MLGNIKYKNLIIMLFLILSHFFDYNAIQQWFCQFIDEYLYYDWH